MGGEGVKSTTEVGEVKVDGQIGKKIALRNSERCSIM
jgi:hypothetical protein